MTIKEFEIQYALGSLPESYLWDIAGNTKTPTNILSILSKNEDNSIRARVAGNSGSPTDVLVRLSKDKRYLVRWNVAENPYTPVDILHILLDDIESIVRDGAAKTLDISARVWASVKYFHHYENKRVLKPI